jgi:DNA segregation ATPase FtsK/SpoIIIE-like protein
MLKLSSVRSLLFALAVLSVVVLAMPATSSAGVIFSVSFGPPPLPVYEQPLCPGEGFIWTPGYWSYDYDFGDYYWVPGTWVRAPRVGYYWTPGYWAYSGSRYVFYDGYWGPQIGFYGGINYGYGYFGNGYEGGRWERNRFYYNRSVNNVNVTNIHNVYNTTIINRTTVNHVSYNGGNGGIPARPTRQQETFARERHLAPVADQTQHRQLARTDREQRASINHGRPAIAATPRPRDFKERVPAREAGGTYNPPANRAPTDQRGNHRDVQSRENQPANRPGQRPENNPQTNRSGQRAENQQRVQEQRQRNDRPPSAMAPRDVPRGNRPAPVTGDNRHEQQTQREQQRVNERQNQQQQRVQQNQERQNQRVEQQRTNEARRQQAEPQHQQQRQQQQQQQQQRVEQRREQPQPQQQQQRAEPRREQPPQQRQQPQNREDNKQKKDRPPNLR